ncbi:24789_t:CDS:1, partial [Cetraspora pellucida]
ISIEVNGSENDLIFNFKKALDKKREIGVEEDKSHNNVDNKNDQNNENDQNNKSD